MGKTCTSSECECSSGSCNDTASVCSRDFGHLVASSLSSSALKSGKRSEATVGAFLFFVSLGAIVIERGQSSGSGAAEKAQAQLSLSRVELLNTQSILSLNVSRPANHSPKIRDTPTMRHARVLGEPAPQGLRIRSSKFQPKPKSPQPSLTTIRSTASLVGYLRLLQSLPVSASGNGEASRSRP